MCVCMYLFMYECIRVNNYLRMHVYIYVCTYLFVCVYVSYTYIHVCVYVIYNLYVLSVQPEISLPNKRIGQSRGRQTILECTITAYPQALSFWEKDGRTITSSTSKHKLEAYDESDHTLTLSLRYVDTSTVKSQRI